MFAGANTAYPGSDLIVGAINSTCNNNCGCSFETYDPVCGSNGVTYYSACFAGCSDIINGTVSYQIMNTMRNEDDKYRVYNFIVMCYKTCIVISYGERKLSLFLGVVLKIWVAKGQQLNRDNMIQICRNHLFSFLLV